MRNLKKIVSLALALMMVLSLMVSANAAFTDADSINANYAEAVEVLTGVGVLAGYTDGSFGPNNTLTRAEAAKIITYVVLGGGVDAYVADALPNPFKDVSGWATNSVKFLYSTGIVSGTSADTFSPTNVLTGYEFARMLLGAAGVSVKNDGAGWKYNTAMAAQANNLLKGMEKTFVLSKEITRAEACQMAFNAMFISTEPVVTSYVIKGLPGEKFDTYSSAYLMAKAMDLNPADVIDTVKVGGSDAIATTVFHLTGKDTVDECGHDIRVWSSVDEKGLPVVVTVIDTQAPAASKFVAKSTMYMADLSELNAYLGLKGDAALKKDPNFVYYWNGYADSANYIDAGANVELYTTTKVEGGKAVTYLTKIVSIEEFVGVASVAEKAETEGENKGLYKWTFSDGYDSAVLYAAKDAYVKGAYYTFVEGLNTVKPAKVVSSAKITGANNADMSDWVTVNGSKLYNAGYVWHNTKDAVKFNTAYDLVLNSNGYLAAICDEAVPAVAPEKNLVTGYGVLLAAQKKVTTNAASAESLLNPGVAYNWKVDAKAQVVTLEGTKVVDLTVVTKTTDKGVVTAATVGGEVIAIENDAKAVDVLSALYGQFVKYTIAEDGSYSFAPVTGFEEIALVTNYPVVMGTSNYMANNATTWNFYEYDATAKTLVVRSAVGYANFVANPAGDGKWYSNVSLNKAGYVETITTLYVKAPVAAPVNYAYYVGVGSYDGKLGYAHKFYVDGAEVELYVADGVKLYEDNVYNLTKNADGVVVAASYVTYMWWGEVVMDDPTLFVLKDGTIVYKAQGCKTYNVAGDTVTAGTLAPRTEKMTGSVVYFLGDIDPVSKMPYSTVIYVTADPMEITEK